MRYLYRRNKNGICIDRIFGYDEIIEIPETLEGLPVTELGAYIFSDHIDRKELEALKANGSFCTEDGQTVSDDGGEPEISGNTVKELYFPVHLNKIGRYAFYNCFYLNKLSFYGELKDIGAGALTGCHKINRISVKADENGESCLRELLTELPETLRVDMEINGVKGRFWFPEFFEEGIENTPARILGNRVHGSGLRYRNSIVHKKLHTLEYDRLFSCAVVLEKEQIVLNLAMDRILYPAELSEESEETYIAYLKEHGAAAIQILGERQDYAAMTLILQKISPERADVEQMLEMAQNSGDSRWVSILMDRLQSHGKKKRKAFEL